MSKINHSFLTLNLLQFRFLCLLLSQLMKKTFIVGMMIALTSSGCATHLSQQQCAAINWQNEGILDGKSGKPSRDLTNATLDCAQFGIEVNKANYTQGWNEGAKDYCHPSMDTGYADGTAGAAVDSIKIRNNFCIQAGINLSLTQYEMGYQKGLKQFCTYDNGMNYATSGKAFPKVCPNDMNGFKVGWNAGQKQFCSNARNGFALGKEGKLYPAVCNYDLFAAFKSEYDRGLAISQKMNSIQTEVNRLNDHISRKVIDYHLIQNSRGDYKLSWDKSQEALNALESVKNLVNEKSPLEKTLFELKVMR